MDHNPPKPPHDPGWNDPPKFAYNPVTAAPKVKLNKRIAFPSQGSPVGAASPIQSTTELAPSGLPMPHSKNAPPPMIPTIANSNSSTPLPLPPPPPPPSLSTNRPPAEISDSLEVLSLSPVAAGELKPRAIGAIDFLIQVCRKTQQLEDILARLELCRRDIETDTLSTDVLRLLIQIHNALCDDKTALALQFQQLLIVNHIQQCAQWGPAIKRIISSPTISDGTTTPEISENDQLSSSVQFFQPVCPDALVGIIPPPPVTPPAEVNETVTVSGNAADAASSEPTSLFQKLKSRILHV